MNFFRDNKHTIFLLMIRQHPTSTLFPYTTLFRSGPVTGLTKARSSFLRSSAVEVFDNWPDEASLVSKWIVSPGATVSTRSEEHTSELQSHVNLVCRLLLEKKNI